MSNQRFLLTAQLRLVAPNNIRQIVSQINAGLQGVRANISINTSGLNQQLSTATRSLSNTSKAAKQAANDMELLGENAAIAIRKYGAFAITTSSFLKFISAVQSGVKDAIEFDREIVRIAQVTGNSISVVKELGDEVTRLSKKFGASSSEVLSTAVTLSQAGLSAKEVKAALETLAKTTVSATFTDIKNTTEASIAIMQQFGKSTSDLEKIFSSVNAVSAKFAVESEDIAKAVRLAGAAFQASGGSLEEFKALFTSVRQTTRESAESIATGLRTIFTRLQRPRTQNFLTTLGIDLKDATGEFVGPYKAIERLSEALKDVSGTDPRFAQIAEELGGYRQISKTIPLIQKFDVSQQALNVALRSGNSLTKDAEIGQEALSIQIARVREEFLSLLRTFTDSSAFRAILDSTLALTKAMISLVSAAEPLLPILTAFATLKLKASLGDFATGFSRRISGRASGGSIKAFASGGVVPGHGSGDTVPAMLTPGEFVIRKKAVEAIGTDTLEGMNRYASGGKITREDRNYRKRKPSYHRNPNNLEAATVDGTDEAIFNRLIYDKDLYTNPGISQYISESTANLNSFLSTGKVYDPFEEVSDYRLDIEKRINDILKRNKFNGLANPQFIKLENSEYSEIPDADKKKIQSLLKLHDSTLGIGDYGREKLAKKLIKEKALKIRSLIDKNKFNKNIILWSALDKYSRESAESQTDGFKINKTFGLKRFLSTSTTSPSNSGFAQLFFRGEKRGEGVYLKIRNFSGQTGLPIVQFDDEPKERSIMHYDMLGRIVHRNVNTSHFGTGENEIVLPNRSLFRVTGPIINKEGIPERGIQPYRIVPVDRLAKGGYSSSDTDTVPALLTPGEFVINKKAASRLGMPTLNKLNNADKVQKFATGGSVQKFALGGTPQSSGVQDFLSSPIGIIGLLASIESLSSSFVDTESSMSKLVSTITQAVFQFGILTTVSKSVIQELPRGIRSSITGERTSKDKADEILLRGYLGNAPGSRAYAKRAINERVAAREARASSIQTGIGIAGSIAFAGGSFLSESSVGGLSKGDKSSVGGFVTGSAISNAGLGASFGSVLGPYGAAAGALIGAIYGTAVGIKKAGEEIEKANFGKKIDSFAKTLDKFISGRLSLGESRASIIDFVNETASKIISSPNSKDIKADFSNQANKVEAFIAKLATNADSFDELQRQTGNLIVNFSRLSDIPFNQLKKEIEDQIDKSKKVSKFNETFQEMAEAENRNVILMTALADSINRVTLSLGEYDSKLIAARSFLSNSNNSFNTLDFTSVLSKSGKIGFSNTDVISQFTQSTFGQLGVEGENAGKLLTATTKAISELPLILLEAKRKTGLDEGEGQFIEVLGNILRDRGFDEDTKTKILSGAKGVIGSELKDERIISAINENLDNVVNEIAKPLSSIIDISEKFANQFQRQTDRIKSAFEIYTEAQVKAAEQSYIIAEKISSISALKEDISGNLRPSSNVYLEERRNIFNLAGSSNPRVLSRRLLDAQNRARNAATSASQTLNISQQELFNKQLADANIEIKLVTSALEKLANSSSTLNQIQKEIAAEEEKRKFRENLTLSAIFGSREAKESLNKQAAFTSLAIERGIDFIPEQERSGVLEFLQSAGKQKINGIPANDIIKQLATQSSTGQRIGSDIVRNNLTQGSGVDGLIADFEFIIKKQVQALSVLQDNVLRTGDDITKAISSENKKFLDDLRSIFIENLVGSKNIEISSVQNQIDSLNKKTSAVNALSRISGFGITDENKADLFGVRDNLSLLLGSLKSGTELAKPFNFQAKNQDRDILIERAINYAHENDITLSKDDLLNVGVGKKRVDTPSFVNGEISYVSEVIDAKLSDISGKLSNQEVTAFSENFNQLLSSRNKDRVVKNTSNTEDLIDKIKSTNVGRSILNTTGTDQTKIEDTIKSLNKSIEILGSGSISELTESIKNLDLNLQKLIKERDTIKRAGGGPVPGVGNSDTIPAMLTPGEFVMKKSAVEAIGLSNLYAMNNGYASGGVVKRRRSQAERLAAKTGLSGDRFSALADSLEQLQVEHEQDIKNISIESQIRKDAKEFKLASDKHDTKQFVALKNSFQNLKTLNSIGRSTEQENRVRAQADSILSSKSGIRIKYGPGQKQLEDEARLKRARALSSPKANELRKQREAREAEIQRKRYLRKIGVYTDDSEKNSKRANLYASSDRVKALIQKNNVSSDDGAVLGSPEPIKELLSKRDIILKQKQDRINSIRAERQNRIDFIKAEKQRKISAYKSSPQRKYRSQFASGGLVEGGSNNLSINGVSELRSAVQHFSTVIDDMSSKLDSFKDLSISLNASHKVEVIFNGAEILTKLQPEITKIAIEQAKVAINNMIDNKFPTVGRV